MPHGSGLAARRAGSSPGLHPAASERRFLPLEGAHCKEASWGREGGGARKETQGLTDQKSRQGSGYSPQAGPRRSLEKIRGQQHEDGVLKQHNLGHQKESQHAWPGAGGLGTLPSRDLLQLPSGLGALSSCPRGLPLLTGPSWKQGQSRVSLSSNGGFSLFSVQLIKITAES